MVINFVCNQKELKKIKSEEIKNYLKKRTNHIWVNISHASNEEVNILKEVFKIHPTTIEDIFSQQTPIKHEEFEGYKVIIFKGIKEVKKTSITTYDIAFVIGDNFLITVNENGSEAIAELLKNEKRVETLLKRGKGYIVHHIIDKEVDRYLKIKTELNEDVRHIEREFMKSQGKETLTKVYSKELNFLDLRHLSESITDLCSHLTKPSESKIETGLIPYFKDVYDHALKTAEGYKSMLERINEMEEMHATMTSMRTNDAMRSLTIIMALMMPLTIITGFFGMNVKIPFQDNPFAALVIFISLIISAVLMIVISRKAGWISKKE
ncbi:MAG: magnesium transporter CorA family protein [Nanoarchaeota archaeon]